jgi:hypothetical protein
MTCFTSVIENTTVITVNEAIEKTRSTRTFVKLLFLVENFSAEESDEKSDMKILNLKKYRSGNI